MCYAAADASKCQTIGSGLVTARAGAVASFRIFAYDLYGNMKTDGSDLFGWSLTHDVEHSCAVSCRSTYNSCDECDRCSALLPFGTFVTCVPDAKHSLQGLTSEHIAGSGYQVEYVAAAAGMYTLSVWLVSEQGNVSIWGSPWKHVRILDFDDASSEDTSSSWDGSSDSASGSWSSVEQISPDLNQTEVDGTDKGVSESVYNVTDGSDSDSGSWFVYGQEADLNENSSLETDHEAQGPADRTCVGETSQKVHFDAAAHLMDSLFFVDVLLDFTLTPALVNTDNTDCSYFIASKYSRRTAFANSSSAHVAFRTSFLRAGVERSGNKEFADPCSSTLGDEFVQCGAGSYCVARRLCRSRMLTDVHSILGRGHRCRFSLGQLRVAVARTGMLLPGDVLTLRECALEAQGYAGQPLSVIAYVHGPTRKLRPEVALSAPTEIGACNQLVIDGTLSTIAGPQQPMTRWTFQGPDHLQHEVIASILAQASVEGDLRIAIDFPQLVGIDTGFGLFAFNLTLQNIITGAVGFSTIVVERKENDAPAVRLSQSRKLRPCSRFIASSMTALSNVLLMGRSA